jgi:ATP-dependent DNA helicase DinG
MNTKGLQPEILEAFFGNEGPLASVIDAYESRPEQIKVAQEVGRSIERGKDLIAEAGTGTGKTLAYLVPALSSGLRVVLSTGTRNLQEQILQREIPLLEKAVGAPFDVQVMKGRSNYLCHYRMNAFTRQGLLPGTGRKRTFDKINHWLETTTTGDRAELEGLPDNSELWREVSATSDQCLGRSCSEFEQCFVTKMRRNAQQAQLVIVNHHLYFADASLRANSGERQVELIPPHDIVIFDEAHDLDEVASQHFGFEVSERRIIMLCRDIFKTVQDSDGCYARVTQNVNQLEIRSRQLFHALPFDRRSGRMTLRKENINQEILTRFQEVDGLLCQIENDLSNTDREETLHLGKRTASLILELAFVLHQPGRAGILSEIESQLDHARTLTPDDDLYYAEPTESMRPLVPFVRYADVGPNGKRIVARPLDVAPLMRYMLGSVPAIYVSATLAVEQSFDSYKSRIGLSDTAEVLVNSPFDYTKQMRLYFPSGMDNPNSPRFSQQAVEVAAELIAASGGGAFVLCTSYNMLETMSRELQPKTGLRILKQGSAPRSELLETFRNDGHAVLVATMSFWQGVDVPGSALRLVVIDRIPFASPQDPLVGARIDYIKSQGQSPFKSYQLPHAAIMLRQGFGRLIRKQSDAGLVAILDPRMTEKGYGKVLLRSLPETPVLRDIEKAQDYLKEMDTQ